MGDEMGCWEWDGVWEIGVVVGDGRESGRTKG